MKKSVLAAAMLLAGTVASSAADMAVKAPMIAPPPQVWTWTGFYLGVHGGAGWGTTESTLESLTGPAVPAVPINLALTQNDRSGALGGGQIGYNYQSGWVVFGVQGDIAATDIKGTTPCLLVLSCTAKSDWLATVSGRIGGVVADRFLVYAKGGAAWLHSKHTLDIPGAFGGIVAAPVALPAISASSTTLGWLLGFGSEYAFTANWTGFIEYNYIDFDKKDVAFDFGIAAPGTVANVAVKNKLSVAKVGVNYKF